MIGKCSNMSNVDSSVCVLYFIYLYMYIMCVFGYVYVVCCVLPVKTHLEVLV